MIADPFVYTSGLVNAIAGTLIPVCIAEVAALCAAVPAAGLPVAATGVASNLMNLPWSADANT